MAPSHRPRRLLVVLVVLSGLATALLGLAGNVASGLLGDVARSNPVSVWVGFGVALVLTIVLSVVLLRADGVHSVHLDEDLSTQPAQLDERQRKLRKFYVPGTEPDGPAPRRADGS